MPSSAKEEKDLKALERELKAWRRKRRRGTRIPEHLWSTAVSASRVHGLWKISNHDAITLLGRPGRRTFFHWKKGAVSRVPDDTVRRISYVLGIYKALQILFSQPAMADAWIKRPNRFFGGQSPLQRMLAGDIVDLFVVRQYLDGARGGWV